MALHEERQRFEIRVTTLQYLVAGLFAVLAGSFWVLQIAQHERFQEMAENNHQRTLPLRAPRGVLFDRDGRILVENRHSYSISIVREHTKDLNRTVSLLATVLGLPETSIRDIVERHKREPSYRPVTIVQDATLAQVAAVSARRLDTELPDVVVEQVPTRQYPNSLASHLFGYVGEVTDAQVAMADELRSGDIVGQAGLEKTYNPRLMGHDGARRVVVNSTGREIRTLEEVQPTEGTRLQLTIDYDLQKAVEDAFAASGFNGAAVLLDPNDGGVLAFASLPSYDPNAFAAGIDRTTWTSLMRDEDRPLNDRAIQGTYSPGSTFKMAVALAALEEGIITPDFTVNCAGSANFYGRDFKCSKHSGHGTIDLRHAIEQSCDVYFYTVGNMLGVDKINKWATLLGLGVKSGIDLPNERQGLVPSTTWKRERMKEKWYAGETISVSIGQGQVSVTPVSMAVYMATLANGGTRVTPHLLKAVDDGNGWKPVPAPPPQSTIAINPDHLQAIHDGLWMVVNAAGTGTTARIEGHDVSGKTGTAQVISNAGRLAARTNRNLRDNGWFVFFAPRDHPTIAGVVFAEHGIHGGNAARITHHVLDTYFAKRDGRPLPPPPEDLHLDLSDPLARPTAQGAAEPDDIDPVMLERRLYHHIDWALLGSVLALCTLGVAMIFSTTSDPTRSNSHLYVTQLYGIGLGLVAMLVTMSLDYRTFTDRSHLFYIALILVLLYVLFFGKVQMGARRWIALGSFNLQPSEFAKIGVALVLAKFFGESRGAPTWLDLTITGALTCLPLAIIAKEPDLGTAVTLLPVFLGIAYAAGLHMRLLGYLALSLVLIAPVAWKFALKDYQKTRISTFLDPSQDAKGAGYQQIQARITVGSGGFLGKGFRQGTQGQLRFLPVAHNDFIFSVLAEEQGLAGVLVTLGLYLIVILRALEAARLAKDRFGSFLVLGVMAGFTFQVVYNITMSAGLAPVKGLTLPLMSYGGSSMIATLAAFGLVLNVRMRRFTN